MHRLETLHGFLDDRLVIALPRLLRHVLSSPEHIDLSSSAFPVVAAAVTGGRSAAVDSGSYNSARLAQRLTRWHTCRGKNYRRGGRVVDGSGLENRQAERPRGFESHPLRSTRSMLSVSRGENTERRRDWKSSNQLFPFG